MDKYIKLGDNVVDTTSLSIDETAEIVLSIINK